MKFYIDEKSKTKVAEAFNEWMRRFIEEPERFEREFQTVALFNAEENAGKTPTYGDDCAAYLLSLLIDLNANKEDTTSMSSPDGHKTYVEVVPQQAIDREWERMRKEEEAAELKKVLDTVSRLEKLIDALK